MGNRLSKIVTKTGDDGTTGLGDGSRTAKTSSRMCAIGDIDELNCVIGLVNVELQKARSAYGYPVAWEGFANPAGYQEMKEIQHRLFDLGGELSIPEHVIIDEDDAKHLETKLEKWNDSLPYLKNFILPGGSELVARLHQARAVCRRAERAVIFCNEQEGNVNPCAIQYLNRLSDFLFVLSRVHSIGNEVLWSPKEKKDV
jgi:cob(I)alamin adenosyltransferase